VNRAGQAQSVGLSEKVVWQLLKGYAAAAGVPGIAPHDLRRSCAKMCRAAGGELEQIQLLLGHASVQTTERYLGTKQDLVNAPNDGIKLRVAV
jgi:site-specific recombinase XerD